MLYLPVAAAVIAAGDVTARALGYAVAAGVLSSVVPYALDLTALRTVPTRLFGIFMSVHPVLAAVAGAAILGQVPTAHVNLGIAIVVATNVVAVSTLRPARPRSMP